MRVAHFTYEFPPSSTGGLGSYVGPLVDFQRENGDDVTVFFLGDGHAPADCVALRAFTDDGQVRRYSADELRRAAGNAAFDVVVCHDWPAVMAAQPVWSSGVPLVFTWHLPLDWDPGWYGDIPCAHAPHIEFTGLAAASRVVVLSSAVERKVRETYSFTAGRVVMVHGGTDTTFFVPSHDEPDPGSILFLGRFCEQKGFDILPEYLEHVLRDVPDAVLHITGIGPLRDSVGSEFSRRGVDHAVTWHPFANSDTVRRLFQRAAVVVFPSRYEPFGLAAIEAMSCGAAVVASRTGGLAETVVDRETGLLADPANPREFAAGTAELIRDPGLRRSVGSRARQRIVDHFSATRCYARLRACYGDVAARRAG